MGIVQSPTCMLGSDPEIFFTQGGKIIGAEKVLPPEGLHNISEVQRLRYTQDEWVRYTAQAHKIMVLDGVQAELHPLPRICRQEVSNEIKKAFQMLNEHLVSLSEQGKKDIKVCFTPNVLLSKKQHKELTPESRILGCQPSYNAYNPSLMGPRVNPETYRRRSAGGHIHLGMTGHVNMQEKERAPRLVRILDTLLGNTCVLIDRDPDQAIRRRNYGRAGEFRLPSYGLEYRTLSNFWLHSYPLMSFVFGVARTALGVLYQADYNRGSKGWSAEKDLMDRVNRADIVRAINKNDFDLAWKNWEKVKGFIMENGLPDSGLNSSMIPAFEKFVAKVKDHGLTYFWPDDPMTYWLNHSYHNGGWEHFIHFIDIKIATAEAVRQPAELKAA